MNELNFKYNIPSYLECGEDLSLECYAYYVGAFNFNWHNHVECLVVVNGSLEACVGGNIYHLEKDDICFIDSKKGHATLSKEKDTVAIVLHFNPKIIQLGEKSPFTISWFGVTNDKTRYSNYSINIRKSLDTIVNSFLEDHPLNQVKRNLATQIILYESLVNFSQLNESEDLKETNSIEDATIRNMIDYLNNNYSERIKLNDLANITGYHPNYTSELFSKHVGIPFTEYLHRYRLTKATKDLKQSDKLISDIALEHGFTNIKAFNTIFREHFGRSPSEYRSSLDQETIAIDSEFKKVFLDTNHEYWIKASKEWKNEYKNDNGKFIKDNLNTGIEIENKAYDKVIELVKKLKIH